MSTIDINAIQQKAAQWIASPVIDKETKNEIQHLLASNEKELIESFYSDLEFGTGGLRGIMGVGTMRMNVYTVGMATQGLANYILAQFPNPFLALQLHLTPATTPSCLRKPRQTYFLPMALRCICLMSSGLRRYFHMQLER